MVRWRDGDSQWKVVDIMMITDINVSLSLEDVTDRLKPAILVFIRPSVLFWEHESLEHT